MVKENVVGIGKKLGVKFYGDKSNMFSVLSRAGRGNKGKEEGEVKGGIIWSPPFTSKVDLLLLPLKLHSIYSVLLLIKRKPYAFKACLQVSSLPFTSSLDSPSKTTSSGKSIHLGANSWMCSVNTSKTKVKR